MLTYISLIIILLTSEVTVMIVNTVIKTFTKVHREPSCYFLSSWALPLSTERLDLLPSPKHRAIPTEIGFKSQARKKAFLMVCWHPYEMGIPDQSDLPP